MNRSFTDIEILNLISKTAHEVTSAYSNVIAEQLKVVHTELARLNRSFEIQNDRVNTIEAAVNMSLICRESLCPFSDHISESKQHHADRASTCPHLSVISNLADHSVAVKTINKAVRKSALFSVGLIGFIWVLIQIYYRLLN